jgi:hypothetical protein
MTAAKPRRSHRNTPRLTARERASHYIAYWGFPTYGSRDQEDHLVRVLQAHAREALRRDQRRDGK